MDCTLYIEICEIRMYISRLLESILTSLYAGAFFQLTMGLIGESILSNFIKPIIVVGEGLSFMYFHFKPLCVINWQSLMSFQSCFWNFLLRCPMVTVKLLLWSPQFSPGTVLIITRELPLSALEIIAPFLSSSYSILFMIFSLCQEMYYKCYIFSYPLCRLVYYLHPDISYAFV